MIEVSVAFLVIHAFLVKHDCVRGTCVAGSSTSSLIGSGASRRGKPLCNCSECWGKWFENMTAFPYFGTY
ncbi:hypothetical protein BFJ63_vAg792 [Fusarium oxysporum f. sp. narcissi]|uniref:Secreted protein n=2 Tax=Fusarium oxysporum TaxID=5507 RepID=A0A420PET2_FUSOX|nr:hypothetical protein BFJ69_g10047 [Fusarium oxysporum]RKK91011.1 hypothetical protein BFJ71_g11199 [Fusarium oxysporum]RKL19564.1 hypothetical protein BFJ70_g13900 [Fusarium oxysporum]RYC96429.1 hypothetical protein BFJ63_vAg792 [Fusarium oxysporum f. sp. narcissi]